MEIKRNSIPNKYDQLPKGTICIIENNNVKLLYIQISRDESNPNWCLYNEKHIDS